MSTSQSFKQSSKWNTDSKSESRDGEWTHVSHNRTKQTSNTRGPAKDTSNTRGPAKDTGYSRQRPKEVSQKTKFYNATTKIDEIMATSNGNITIIEQKCWDIINALPGKEEKAKAIETVVSYSLHELITADRKIGQLIHTDLSVSSGFGSIKERDGYNLFVWAVWTRYGEKRSIANLFRTNEDVLKTVDILLSLNISPFRINAKKESIVGTMDVCLKDGKITQTTYDEMYQKIFGTVIDTEFYSKCITCYIPEMFQDDISFEKSLVLWGLCQDNLDNQLIETMFKMDIDRVGLADISRKSADIEYFPVFFKLIEFIKTGKVHNDLTKYFKTSPLNKQELITKIASYYMDKLFETYPTIYEHSISDGYAGKKDGICFKYYESFGSFVWDISKYLEFNDEVLSHFDIKVQIGYGIRGMKKDKKNIELLKSIYPRAHISSKILIENAFASVNIPFNRPVEEQPVKVVEKKENPLKNLKTGLEKIGSNKVIYKETEVYPPEVDDAVFYMSKISPNVKPSAFADAFVMQACLYLFHENQISQLGGLVEYLDKSKILSKTAISEFLDENEALVLDDTECDNPQAKKVIAAIHCVL
jgi:hypothetical protein